MIAIVVTTYNKPHFLINALNGCLSQDIEKDILVINDAGHIPPEEVMDFISDHGIKYERRERNQGLSFTRNYGIANTKGDWVVVVDEDDWLYDNALPQLISRADPEDDIIYGQMMTLQRAYPVPNVSQHDFRGGNPIFVTSPYRRRVWNALGGYKVWTKSFYEDWNFWLRARMAGFNFKYVPMLVYRRFERPDSMCRMIEPYKNEAILTTLIDGYSRKEIYEKCFQQKESGRPRNSYRKIHPVRQPALPVHKEVLS